MYLDIDSTFTLNFVDNTDIAPDCPNDWYTLNGPGSGNLDVSPISTTWLESPISNAQELNILRSFMTTLGDFVGAYTGVYTRGAT